MTDGLRSDRLATALVVEARRRYEAGDLADARSLAERAVERLRAGVAAPAAPDDARDALGEALGLAGELAFELGDYGAVRELVVESQAIHDSLADADAARGGDLNLLGLLEIVGGRPAAAVPLLRESVRLREAALGLDDPLTIESVNNLGVALWRSGERTSALDLHAEALARCERSLGQAHRRTAETLNALAVKEAQEPRTRELARAHSERALEVAEAALGPDHPLVATLTANVATGRADAGDVAGAAALAGRSLELHERRFGPTHPNTASALAIAADVADLDGRPADARTLLERALAIRLDTFGAEHPETAGTVERLLGVLVAVGRDDPATMGDAMALYAVHAALSPSADLAFRPPGADPARASGELRAYLARREAAAAPVDPADAARLERFAALLVSADDSLVDGDPDASARTLTEAVELLASVRGPVHLDLVEPLRRLAAAHRARGRGDEAIAADERAVRILAAEYGELHPYTVGARAALMLARDEEYGPGAGSVDAATMLEALPAESGPADAGVTELLRRSLELRTTAMDAAPDPVGISNRRAAALAAPSPLVDELLAGLEAVDWSRLGHAHGPATDTPREIRLLLSDDGRVVVDALGRLAGSIAHQGTVYPATAAALPYLLRLAGDERVARRADIAALAAWIVRAGREVDEDAPWGPSILAGEARIREVLAALVARGDGDADAARIGAEAIALLDAPLEEDA